jgi:hypothetical protein
MFVVISISYPNCEDPQTVRKVIIAPAMGKWEPLDTLLA